MNTTWVLRAALPHGMEAVFMMTVDDFPTFITIGEGAFFVEPAQFNGTLYILGAGHLGVETARLAHGTGFKIVSMDDRERLDKVYSPIGLFIGAQPPAEIAVSIVAELIQARYLSV